MMKTIPDTQVPKIPCAAQSHGARRTYEAGLGIPESGNQLVNDLIASAPKDGLHLVVIECGKDIGIERLFVV